MTRAIEKKALFLIHSSAKAGSRGQTALQAGKFLASTRIQLGPAMQAAANIGLEPDIRNLRAENPDYLNEINNHSICIFGKLAHPDNEFAKK